jgi:D-alanyl-D-alanine carboxypeptidase
VIARPLPRAIVAVLALVLLATATAAPTAAAPTPPVEPELAAKLQQRLDGWRRNHRAPGVAAAVRLPDGSRWLGTSGRAIRGKDGRNVEPHTPFAVASLTKTFVAATILQLRDEGKLQLGMRISRWLPKYPQAKRITIKNLLNHRSGLVYRSGPSLKLDDTYMLRGGLSY